MRLILSGVQDFDQKNMSNVRLLGPWCLQKDQNPIPLESLEMFKEPKRPVNSVSLQGTQKIEEAISRVLPALALAMNRYHGRNYSERFWDILTRHTVTGLMVLLYDRYCRLTELLDSDETFETEIYSDQTNLKRPLHFAGLIWGEQPVFNHFVYSRLVKFLNKPNLKFKEFDSQPEIYFHDNTFKALNRRLTVREHLGKIKKKIMMAYNQTFFNRAIKKGLLIRGVPGLEPRDLRKLVREMDRIGVPIASKIKRDAVTAKISRKSDSVIRIQSGSDDTFIQFVDQILPSLLPTIMTDGFEEWEAQGLKLINSRVRLCIFGPNFADKWVDRMELSLYKEFNGALCIGTQHGTGYGTFRYCPDPFQTEYKMFDEFNTWGWTQHEGVFLKANPLPQPMFAKIENTHRQVTDDIVFIGTLASGTVYFGLPVVDNDECYSYFLAKEKFLRSLNKNNYKDIFYRAYFAGTLFVDELKFVKDRFPELRLCKEALWPVLQTCRLAVLDHPGSTMHILASMNTPFILYKDPELWPMAKEMMPFLELFKKVGIYHESPESAAEKVNQIGQDVGKWWNSAEVQNARIEFIRFHALTSKNWPQVWAQFIADRLNQASKL